MSKKQGRGPRQDTAPHHQHRQGSPARAMRHRPLCDFCGGPRGLGYTRWRCRDFARSVPTSRGTVLTFYRGHWAACRTCTPLVERRAWREITDRVMAGVATRGVLNPLEAAMFRSETAGLLLTLDGHLTGEVA
jgi:hypothetical protein